MVGEETDCLEGYRQLGHAVLLQAWKDAGHPGERGQEAREFLRSDDLAWWVGILGLESVYLERMRERGRERL